MTIDVENWRATILGAKSRAAARKALRCSFKELKDFRAQHMPEHQWPDPRAAQEIAREQFEARERQRMRQNVLDGARAADERRAEIAREPTGDEIEAAILNMNPRQIAAMETFMPGMHPRKVEAVHHQLHELGLIQSQLRPTSKANLLARGDYLFTPLGRAVQNRLKNGA